MSEDLPQEAISEATPEATGEAALQSAIPADELARLTDDLIGAIKTVYDPEIPVDIYELGLIYKIDVSDDRDVVVDMTLTAPGCGMGQVLMQDVERKVQSLDGIDKVVVDLTFDPPWTPERMSEEARLTTGLY